MGFFKDTFTKGAKASPLAYDDAAFNYFIFAILLFIFLPLLYMVSKRFLYKLLGWIDVPINYRCICSHCAKVKVDHERQIRSSWFTCGFFIQIVLVCLVGYSLFIVYSKFGKEGAILKSFDPYDILEVPTNATIPEIKSAYRKLAVKYHPDKNQGDPEAASKFDLIVKAYEALTDDKAKRNYELYGNPDGPGPLEIGIALPEFLIKKENQITVLVVFFLFLLVIIPGIGLYWFSSVSKYNKNGIHEGNLKRYAPLLSENTPLKKFSFIMATSEEFEENLTIGSKEEPLLYQLMNDIGAEKVKNLKPKIYKAMLLIDAYTKNVPIKDPKLLADQEYILKLCPRILSFIIEIALENAMYCKLIGFRAIKYSQLFLQGLEHGDSHYLQLPYMTHDKFKKLQRNNKIFKSPFREYVRLPKEQLRLEPIFTPEEITVIENTIKSFPKLELKVRFYVKGSDKFYQGDVMTIDVTAKKKYDRSIPESNLPSAIHSNHFPFLKQEILWLIIASKEQKRVYEHVKLHRPFTRLRKEYQVLLDRVNLNYKK